MKIRSLLLCATGLVLGPLAQATVTFDMTLDQLTDSGAIPVPDGMAVFLVADTSNNGFTLPIAGSYTMGSAWAGSADDKILWSYATNGNTQTTVDGSMDNLSPSIDYSLFAGLGAGDHLAVYWFPSTAYSATTVIGGTAAYGTFGFGGSGSDNTAWVAPSDPSSAYSLPFLTSTGTTFGTGNDVALFGSVPEPSSYALLGGLVTLALAALRRRKTVALA